MTLSLTGLFCLGSQGVYVQLASGIMQSRPSRQSRCVLDGKSDMLLFLGRRSGLPSSMEADARGDPSHSQPTVGSGDDRHKRSRCGLALLQGESDRDHTGCCRSHQKVWPSPLLTESKGLQYISVGCEISPGDKGIWSILVMTLPS